MLNMTDKSINISEEVYKKLTELKHKDESISSFILRLLDKKKMSYLNNESGVRTEEDSEEWEKIEKIIYEDRLKGKDFRDIEI